MLRTWFFLCTGTFNMEDNIHDERGHVVRIVNSVYGIEC